MRKGCPLKATTQEKGWWTEVDDYALLGLGHATTIIERIHVDEGAGRAEVLCRYDPQGMKLPYRLVFQGCRILSYETYPAEGEPLFPADLLGISLGTTQQPKSATLATDTFELSFLYDSFILEKPTPSSSD
jgi:hypothetical protein